MKSKLQKYLFKLFSIKNYLRILQHTHFICYNLGILKHSKNYALHYFVKNLIHEGNIVIDIGSNLGYYSIPFSKWVGKTGHVFSVEPIPIYNEIFKEISSKYNNITIYPYALGNEDRVVEMVNPLQNGYLRTGLPHIYDENTDGNINNIEYKFKVQMKRPSLLFTDLKKIDYIKCDIEGFEYVVLYEMRFLINKFKPIVQVEVWDDNDKLIRSMFREMNYKLFFLNNENLEEITDENIKPSSDYIFVHNTEDLVV